MLPLYDNQPKRRFPFITIILIALNAAVFTGWQLRIGIDQSAEIAGMQPAQFLRWPLQESLLHMVAAMFMHGGWTHLIGNMWFLWIFGSTIEGETGSLQYMVFYFICGLIAAFAHILFTDNIHTPMIGASGAISGVLGAYLILHPTAEIATFVPLWIFLRVIALPAWVFLMIWIGLQIFSQTAVSASAQHSGGGVAYLAHIGGFFAGMILIFFFKNER
jgi:membrane associated rhomboid family serine protease